MAEVASKRRVVNKFEGRLLTIVRGIVRLGPIDAALPFVFDKLPAPSGLGTTCIQLVCDSLAKGCVHYLSHNGGWRHERFLSNGQPIEGRLWNRVPLDERRLTFSRHCLEFLIWLTAQHPVHAKMGCPPFDELTFADHLILFLAYDALRSTEAGRAWRIQPLFARNSLCRIYYPEEFSESRPPIDFAPWMTGLGAAILETMQKPLADRWLAVECGKRGIGDWKQYRMLVEAQDQVVETFLSTVENAGRRDLAKFLLHAAVRFCRGEKTKSDLMGNMQGDGPSRLADRYAMQKQSAILARALDRMDQWRRQARSVGFMDDDYAVAQYWLNEWDLADADIALASAQQLLRQLEPMRLETKGDSDEPSLSHSHT